MIDTSRADVQAVRATFNATGTTAPDALEAAVTQQAQATEAANHLGVPAQELAEAFVNALARGVDDPATDPTVQALITTNALAGVRDHVIATALGRTRETFVSARDEIVSIWRKPYNTARDALTSAHQALGGVDLDDTATIVSLGGDAADVWAAATKAARTIDTINHGWVALARLCRVDAGANYQPLRLAAIDWDTWKTQELARKSLTPWDAIGLGLHLDLPTLAEYRARVATLEQGRTDEQARRTQAQKDSVKTPLPVWSRVGR